MFVAIDPGNTGALAFLGTREFKLCALYDMPTYPEPSSGRMRYCIDGAMLAHYFSEHRPTCALVERVASRPGQGVAGVYAFGRGVGVIEGVLQALDIPIHYVAPQTWKRHHNLLKQPKTASLSLARALYPDAELHLKKHDGRADAILMGVWKIEKWKGLWNIEDQHSQNTSRTR